MCRLAQHCMQVLPLLCRSGVACLVKRVSVYRFPRGRSRLSALIPPQVPSSEAHSDWRPSGPLCSLLSTSTRPHCTHTYRGLSSMSSPATSAAAASARASGSGAGAGAGAGSGPAAVAVPVLDKASFTRKYNVAAIRVPAKQTGTVMKALKGHLLQLKHTKCVLADPSDRSYRLLLMPQTTSLSADGALVGAPEASVRKVAELLPRVQGQLVSYALTTGYDNMSAEQVLRALLPAGVTVPSAFETVGHIAHLNLRDDTLPYRHLVGQVLLDKHKTLETIVNKVGTIHTKFRTFEMEVIAGEPKFEVNLNESGARFRFNFRDVYWNSRLQMEHLHIVKALRPTKPLICDMFCGVGPFAIPLALAGCTMYANDLNPHSYHYLTINAKLNKVERLVHSYNMDARDFIRKMAAERVPFEHILMNLPADAIAFADAFIGMYHGREAEWEGKDLPMMHCYCFSKEPTLALCKKEVVKRLEGVMRASASTDGQVPSVRLVRDVAPRKTMLCISCRVPRAVAFAAPLATVGEAAGAGAGSGSGAGATSGSGAHEGAARSAAAPGTEDSAPAVAEPERKRQRVHE